MSPIQNDVWKRGGFTFLWDAIALSSFSRPSEAISLHALFALKEQWPAELPSGQGNCVIVAGLDSMIDILAKSHSPEFAETWLTDHLKPLILDFQIEYENQYALIFWLPRGRERLVESSGIGWRYLVGAGRNDGSVAILRCLFAGAEQEVQRIVTPSDPHEDKFIGLHHRRIS